MAITKSELIPKTDGTVLSASFHVPTDLATGKPANPPARSGGFPVLLSETPYGKSFEDPIDPYLVERGYIGVSVDVAGTGGSTGQSQLFGPAEAADSVQAINWAANRPNSDRKVGMVGISYMAIDQLFAAAAVGPNSPLKAIFPVAASVDPYRDLFVSGGLVNMESSLGLIVGYAGPRTLTSLEEQSSKPADALALSIEHGLDLLPFEGQTLIDVLANGPRRFDGSWWQQRAPEGVLPQIVKNNVAMYLVGGEYDVFQRGEPQLYSELQNLATGHSQFAPMAPDQAVSPDYQLLFGPWDHGDEGSGINLELLQLQWFDQWLKGENTGIVATTTPLHVIEPTGGTFNATDYPVESTSPQRFYLGPNSRLTTTAPNAEGGSDTLLFTHLSNPCDRSTQQWSAGVIPSSDCGDTGPSPWPAPTELTYTTAPVPSPVTIAGPIGLTVQATSITPETMWVANLEDVAPNGTATSLSGGALIGSMRTLDTTRSGLWPGASNAAGGAATVLPYYPFTQASEKPVTPGLVTRFDIENRPVFATLKPGHSLRLVLGTGDLPHLMPNTTEGPLLLGGIYSVQHNAASLSWIDIPVGTNPAS